MDVQTNGHQRAPLWSTREVAERLGVNPQVVHYYALRGVLSKVYRTQGGRQVLMYRAAEVKQVLEARAAEPAHCLDSR